MLSASSAAGRRRQPRTFLPSIALILPFGYRFSVTDIDAEKIDAAIQHERTRLVALLHRLADKIEAAPTERVTDDLTWIAPAAQSLLKTVERALGRST